MLCIFYFLCIQDNTFTYCVYLPVVSGLSGLTPDNGGGYISVIKFSLYRAVTKPLSKDQRLFI